MAKFLNTTSLNFFLEELIRKSTKNLILVSPYLKINARIRELLEDKVEAGLKVQVVYGKTDIAQTEKDWFATQPLIDVRFCKNLHAKCYMNDSNAIITSLNLYEFSQINNNEMGVLLTASKDTEAFKDTTEEVMRLVKNSELVSFIKAEASPELDITADPEPESSGLVSSLVSKVKNTFKNDDSDELAVAEKLTTSKLAKKLGKKTAETNQTLVDAGYLEKKGENFYLTDKGKKAGGEFKKGQYGIFFLWPDNINL